jgi:hypothetical protein
VAHLREVSSIRLVIILSAAIISLLQASPLAAQAKAGCATADSLVNPLRWKALKIATDSLYAGLRDEFGMDVVDSSAVIVVSGGTVCSAAGKAWADAVARLDWPPPASIVVIRIGSFLLVYDPDQPAVGEFGKAILLDARFHPMVELTT